MYITISKISTIWIRQTRSLVWIAKSTLFNIQRHLLLSFNWCEFCSKEVWASIIIEMRDWRKAPVWRDWAIYWTLGNFSKPLVTINLPKSLTFLGKFCKDVKIFNFSNEIIFGQLLYFIDIWRLFTDNTVRDRHYKPFTVTWESPV